MKFYINPIKLDAPYVYAYVAPYVYVYVAPFLCPLYMYTSHQLYRSSSYVAPYVYVYVAIFFSNDRSRVGFHHPLGLASRPSWLRLTFLPFPPKPWRSRSYHALSVA